MKTYPALIIKLTLAIALFANLAMADETAKTKARQHFKQGVALFDERRFGDALLEFDQSYALFPVYSTLFNVGQVQVALGHPVQAADAFEKFLVQGGSSIAADQRTRVETELATQRERIGDIKFNVTPDGAQVRVDGEPVGKAPIATAVRVAAGHHRIEAMLDGYHSEQTEVDVPGRGHVELMFKLQSAVPQAPPPVVAPVQSAPQSAPAAAPVTPAPAPVIVLPSQQNVASAPHQNGNSSASSSGGVQRALGYGFAAAGLAGAGVGIAFAVDGQSKHDKALTQWANGDHPTARITEDEANKEKTKGYVVIGVGGAAMLTGAILLITAPSGNSSSARTQFSPWVAANTAGASVGGCW